MSQEEIEKYKQEITTRFEKATAENEKFGAVSLRMFLWLTKYKFGEPIPEVFWQLYQLLSDSVNKDDSGKLLFTDAEYAVMKMINTAMKKGGFVITLPNKDLTYQKLALSADQFAFRDVLEKAFFSPFLQKSGEDLDLFSFMGLITLGIKHALVIVKDLKKQDIDQTMLSLSMNLLADIVTIEFPDSLIDSFWDNRHVALYAKEFRAGLRFHD